MLGWESPLPTASIRAVCMKSRDETEDCSAPGLSTTLPLRGEAAARASPRCLMLDNEKLLLQFGLSLVTGSFFKYFMEYLCLIRNITLGVLSFLFSCATWSLLCEELIIKLGYLCCTVAGPSGGCCRWKYIIYTQHRFIQLARPDMGRIM